MSNFRLDTSSIVDRTVAVLKRDATPVELKRLRDVLAALRREYQEAMEDLVGDELLRAQGACRVIRDLLLTLSRETPSVRKHRTGSYQ